VLKLENHSHHQVERADRSRAGGRLKGDAVGFVCLRVHVYGICLQGHVTRRSRPTVPLPTIQFAINSARSESTGYAPFFLNNGRMPRTMVWNSASSTEYSNVREFAQKKKLALMSAHDSIIGARVKQTRDTNRKRQLVPFKEGDFVYLSTKNITFARGLAWKLIPKYIGPYKITKDFKNQSFKLELPMHLKKRGVHDVFHSSLLRIHAPNDDRLFPG
jgi:hypothetical protein